MSKYIYQNKAWPHFTWDQAVIAIQLARIHQRQGFLLGQMLALGFSLQNEAMLKTLTLEVVKNSEIENEILNSDEVRSSIARRLGMDVPGLIASSRDVDGVVEMTLDAVKHFNKPLTKERLCNWHAALFPTGRSGMSEIIVANWRDDKKGEMRVVSGAIGKEKIHYEAPPAEQINHEMQIFLAWFNANNEIDLVLTAGIAHLWFITIHPFEDGNGRIARALTELLLARNDGAAERFYSLSAQIRLERNEYYHMLEQTQKSGLDITAWLQWFLAALERALSLTDKTLMKTLNAAHFWEKHPSETFNGRQRVILKKLLDEFFGKLTTSKWAAIAKCSHDTALRDIQDLIHRGILIKEIGGSKNTSYRLADIGEEKTK